MVFITRVGNLVVRIHLPRRNVLNGEEWVTSPQIAKRKMKKIVARARSLKERKSYSRSITRRKMARLAMLSWIRVQVRTPILMMKPSKRGCAGIAIKEAPSLFDTPYCLRRYVMMMNCLMVILLRW
jgi:hypothetical protein